MALRLENNLERLIKAWMEEYIRDQERLGNTVNFEASINGFAKVTNMKQPTLWKYTRPELKHFPSVELTLKLCRILGCTLDDMFVIVYVPDSD